MKKGVDYIGVTTVFYCHDGKRNILLQKRSKNCQDEIGRWDCGGGSMKFGETFEECLIRELKEEYGCEPIEFHYAATNNVLRKHNGRKTHWIALLYAVLVDPEKVKLSDPDKMEKIGWFPFDALPSPLHSKFRKHFEMVKKSKFI
ncbi:MAG: hypothetical protein A2687_05585 [Candidatus Levybacteria bacterium RIFCSPHIGHO2_01_FULL_38_26]|nr:MAG: hypothetical protein A2687_05585 [Candidatus Levybacteria bacterium RIFCSPHIGHO2_01_FULL_38_26]